MIQKDPNRCRSSFRWATSLFFFQKDCWNMKRILLFVLVVVQSDETYEWGFKNGVLHNSIWLEQAAGVYHRESRHGKYRLTYREAKAVCEYEGGQLATYDQLEEARKIGFHVCAAGWLHRGRVGYPIVKPTFNCGFGRKGIIDYGYRLNKSEKWDAYCFNPNGKECGGVLTEQERIIKSPGYPDEYENKQICYWHIRLKLGQRIHIQFLDMDIEEDTDCLSDYFEIYDSYDDIHGFVGRYCGFELPEDIISTGNVMTLKFLTDGSITAAGFQIKYSAIDPLQKYENETLEGQTDYVSYSQGYE